MAGLVRPSVASMSLTYCVCHVSSLTPDMHVCVVSTKEAGIGGPWTGIDFV